MVCHSALLHRAAINKGRKEVRAMTADYFVNPVLDSQAVMPGPVVNRWKK